ncbi:hypothetical protein [Variovorax sp. J22R115]|uniref:hypothetical protein n=1 Tax=Variovorax sp. J22R115 TaxID=3053509 RepID=UPI0025785A6A|nr:hypothetical protein [Variovorax sp. J22R115]MDM0049605.1 hypothetical protein [Variovorax sp. J22R115]
MRRRISHIGHRPHKELSNESVDIDCRGVVVRLRATAFDRNAAPAVRQLLRCTGIWRLPGMRHCLSSESAAFLQGRNQYGVQRRGLLYPRGIVHVRMSPRIDRKPSAEIDANRDI